MPSFEQRLRAGLRRKAAQERQRTEQHPVTPPGPTTQMQGDVSPRDQHTDALGFLSHADALSFYYMSRAWF